MTDERAIHRLSKEYVKVRVTEPTNVYDPAVIEVRVGPGDWRPTEVLTERDATTGTSRVGFVCEPVLDGLGVGNHEVLVRVADNPEIAVFGAGVLSVTE